MSAAAKRVRSSDPTGRQEAILEAALSLFDERGFHGTALTDIGKAVGVTGPALYRHFASKDEILAKALTWVGERIWLGVDEAAEAAPKEALESLLRSQIDVAVDEGRVIALWQREERNLPEHERHSVRRFQHRYIEEWIRALSRFRPDLPYADARTIVQATLGLVHSAAMYRDLHDPARLKPLLRELAWSVLTTEVSASPEGGAEGSRSPQVEEEDG